MNHDFEARVSDVKSRARGHWTPILRSLGVDEEILKGKNLPCPIDGCGGTDRFQYTDKFGEGNYHCRSCGAGGGLKLAHAVRGGRFSDCSTTSKHSSVRCGWRHHPAWPVRRRSG
jgi:putative DNA primase/helicase